MIKNIENVKIFTKNMRRKILNTAYQAGAKSAHVGGALSCTELISILFTHFNLKNLEDDKRDRFILSKGHACLAYYSALSELGFISDEELKTFEEDGSNLLGHPVLNKKLGIEFSTGSLGMGLSIGIGLAIASEKKKLNFKTFVLLGDGECNEGSIWEAAMFASAHKVDNIISTIDYNGRQIDGDVEDIISLARKYNLKVIEDAAQSFGGSIRDKKVGTFGDIAATSFYPAKPLGCYGDGGAIFTNDDDLAEECKAIRIHGTKKDKYNSEMIGLNGRLDSIQAAVLLEKLSIFDKELKMRNEVNFHYRKYLNNAQYLPKDYQSAHALFSIVLGSKIKRDDLVERLSKNKIPSVIYYKFPIHLMKAFQYLGYHRGSLPVSESLSNSIVSLPMHPYLSKADISLIIETIQRK